MDLHFNHRFNAIDSVLLFGGSTAMSLLLAYSALEAPAGRNALYAALGVFMFSFVPQLFVHEWMGEWVWGVRYLGVGAIAGALLLRLRRTRPGSYGVFLRAAALVGTWWGLQMTMKLAWTHSNLTVRSELFSRVVYLLLAAGMLDMRRFVGAVPLNEPVRTPMHTAREIATTRVCLALLSLGVTTTALDYAWHSEWNVIAAAEVLGVAVTLAFHLPWVWKVRGLDAVCLVAMLSFGALAFAWLAYKEQPVAPRAIALFAFCAIVVDLVVERFAAASRKDPDASSTRALAALAVVLHALAAVIAIARIV
jgi:hypothetical protein